MLCGIIITLTAQSVSTTDEDNAVMSAKVVSCTGWRLNKLPEVKRFINRDIPLFHNVEFEAKPGASPELFLLNSKGNTVEKFDLSKYDQQGCNKLLKKKGFFKREDMGLEVPEEYKFGPYVEQNDEEELKEGKTPHPDL